MGKSSGSKITKISDIKVRSRKGKIPFSVGYLADTLLKIGISDDVAFEHANAISLEIVKNHAKREITSDEVFQIAIEWYKAFDESLAERVRIISKDYRELRPIIILLGGVTGIGKSTLATQLAKRLDIRSIMGTDLIREVMRLVISVDLMPTLHSSSYIAFKEIENRTLPSLSPTILGFEEQARKVVTGVEAVITQAIKDNDIMIIEGVHLMPGILRSMLVSSANVIQLQLYLEDEQEHMSRLIRREKAAIRSTAYSKYFSEIREIQDYLVSLSKKFKIPRIEVSDDEAAVVDIINEIWQELQKRELNVY